VLTGDDRLMIREVEAAYRNGRTTALVMGTWRLRWQERQLRSQAGRLTRAELAYLAGLRDELRERGWEIPELWPS